MLKTTVVLAVGALLCGCASSSKPSAATPNGDFQKDFAVAPTDFSSIGRNDYFILEPGYQHVYRSEDGELIITVLRETRTIDGVQTRIVEERETAHGQPSEISRNFYAIDKRTNDVYYFGEETDVYKNGKIVSHPDGWISGVNGAHYGLFMPAKPTVGQKFYQEYAPEQAMDRCEVVSTSDKIDVPLGSFDHCIKFKETTPLESDVEYKIYAPAVGLLQDEDLKLVKHGPMSD